MSLPVIDELRIESFYTSLGEMTVALDTDPLQFGPARLNGKVADVRAMMTRCEQLVLQVSKDLHAYRREHRRYRVEYEIRESELLAGDPDVRGRSNLADRKAVIAQKLKPELQMLNSLSFAIQDLETLEKVATTKRQDLRDLTNRLKDQVMLCKEQMGMGDRWGRTGAQGYVPQPGVQGKTPTQHDPKLGSVDVASLVGEMEGLLDPLEIPVEDSSPKGFNSSPDSVDDILAQIGFLVDGVSAMPQ